MSEDPQVNTAFPDVWGGAHVSCPEHHGPTFYVSGGESVKVKPTWRVRIAAWVGAGVTYSGTFRVDVLWPGPGARATVTLVWRFADTGQEVFVGADLSQEVVRLLVVEG